MSADPRRPQPHTIEDPLDAQKIQENFEALFSENLQGLRDGEVEDLFAEIADGDAGYVKTDADGVLSVQATPLPIADGGTAGSATPTAGGAAYGTGSAYAFTGAGTTGQVLTSQGSSAPTWTTLSATDAVDRVVETGTTRTIATTYSLTAADYFAVEGTGTLAIEGDGALWIG